MDDSKTDALQQLETLAVTERVERNELKKKMQHIAAAWQVWADATTELRRRCVAAWFVGDLPDAAQQRDAGGQVRAQIFEAYARGRVQALIVEAVDGVDQVATYDQHWRDTWGDENQEVAYHFWLERFAETLDQQHSARAAAAAQTLALEQRT